MVEAQKGQFQQQTLQPGRSGNGAVLAGEQESPHPDLRSVADGENRQAPAAAEIGEDLQQGGQGVKAAGGGCGQDQDPLAVAFQGILFVPQVLVLQEEDFQAAVLVPDPEIVEQEIVFLANFQREAQFTALKINFAAENGPRGGGTGKRIRFSWHFTVGSRPSRVRSH